MILPSFFATRIRFMTRIRIRRNETDLVLVLKIECTLVVVRRAGGDQHPEEAGREDGRLRLHPVQEPKPRRQGTGRCNIPYWNLVYMYTLCWLGISTRTQTMLPRYRPFPYSLPECIVCEHCILVRNFGVACILCTYIMVEIRIV